MEEIKNVNQAPEVDVIPEEIIVSDGKKSIPIKNQIGELIGVFRYNPTDLNMVNRYREVADKIDDIVKPLENVGITVEGEGEDEESIEAVNEVEKRLIEVMDYMLDGNSREAFFAKTHALTPVGGSFYFEKVFEAIGLYLEKIFDVEFKTMSKREDKHTHGYRTGKHKKGDR